MSKVTEVFQKPEIIACIWDFDKTLISGYMQSDMLKEYGIDEHIFWKYINHLHEQLLQEGIQFSDSLAYLTFMISAVKKGYFPGLNRKKLEQYGQSLQFFPGALEFLKKSKQEINNNPDMQEANISLEHYIVSSGNAETINGSEIAPLVDGVFATRFIGEEIDHIVDVFFTEINKKSIDTNHTPNSIHNKNNRTSKSSDILYISELVDSTHKTRCIFEINKGCNKNKLIDINTVVPDNQRRVQFENMIYIADGPSDIPAFSVIRERGGKAFAVYNPNNDKELEQVDQMLQEHRVDAYGPTDYTPESITAKWINMHIKKIAQRLIQEQQARSQQQFAQAPTHIHE